MSVADDEISIVFPTALLGVTQLFGWATTYFVPAVLAPRIAAELDMPQWLAFGGSTAFLISLAFSSLLVGRWYKTLCAAPILAGGSVLAALFLFLLSQVAGCKCQVLKCHLQPATGRFEARPTLAQIQDVPASQVHQEIEKSVNPSGPCPLVFNLPILCKYLHCFQPYICSWDSQILRLRLRMTYPSTRRRAARLPQDQGTGQGKLLRTGPLAGDPGQQHLDGSPAGLDDRQLDRGQRRVKKSPKGLVVKADDADILRHP